MYGISSSFPIRKSFSDNSKYIAALATAFIGASQHLFALHLVLQIFRLVSWRDKIVDCVYERYSAMASIRCVVCCMDYALAHTWILEEEKKKERWIDICIISSWYRHGYGTTKFPAHAEYTRRIHKDPYTYAHTHTFIIAPYIMCISGLMFV